MSRKTTTITKEYSSEGRLVKETIVEDGGSSCCCTDTIGPHSVEGGVYAASINGVQVARYV